MPNPNASTGIKNDLRDDKQLEPYGLKQFEIRSSEVANKAYTPIGEDWYINIDEKLIVAPCEDEQTRCVYKIIKK